MEKREAFTRGERRFHKLRACKSRQVFSHGNRLGPPPPPSHPNARNFLISASLGGGEVFFFFQEREESVCRPRCICPVHTSRALFQPRIRIGCFRNRILLFRLDFHPHAWNNSRPITTSYLNLPRGLASLILSLSLSGTNRFVVPPLCWKWFEGNVFWNATVSTGFIYIAFSLLCGGILVTWERI